MSACDPLCGNEVLSWVVAPDGKTEAVVFRRDCGATTSYSEQVSVVPRGSSFPTGGGNIFVSDDESRTPGGVAVKVEWLSPTDLEITYDGRARIYKKLQSKGPIHIDYRAGVAQ
jgi:hypothetical protein